MKRVVIFHRDSSICLVNRTWGDWSGSDSETLICPLVASYAQLGKELGAGSLCAGSFSKQDDLDIRKTPKLRFESVGRPNMSYLQNLQGSLSKKYSENTSALEMVVESGQDIVSVGFFDPTASKEDARAFTKKCLSTFVSKHSDTMKSFSDLFESVSKNPDHEFDPVDILKSFQSFQDDIDSIYATV